MTFKLTIYNFETKNRSEFFYDDWAHVARQLEVWRSRNTTKYSLTISCFVKKESKNEEDIFND